ncbi:hypothetical protein DCPSUM001_12020 [Dysgonomonas capnocytophagoides]|nr:hypothetical protein DCPSUM001_12020 [Dysgonomonas capnocytophagoides]
MIAWNQFRLAQGQSVIDFPSVLEQIKVKSELDDKMTIKRNCINSSNFYILEDNFIYFAS